MCCESSSKLICRFRSQLFPGSRHGSEIGLRLTMARAYGKIKLRSSMEISRVEISTHLNVGAMELTSMCRYVRKKCCIPFPHWITEYICGRTVHTSDHSRFLRRGAELYARNHYAIGVSGNKSFTCMYICMWLFHGGVRRYQTSNFSSYHRELLARPWDMA